MRYVLFFWFILFWLWYSNLPTQNTIPATPMYAWLTDEMKYYSLLIPSRLVFKKRNRVGSTKNPRPTITSISYSYTPKNRRKYPLRQMSPNRQNPTAAP